MTHQDADAREIAVTQSAPNSNSTITRLILVPSLITLAVTLLRLVGELEHWSRAFFNPEAGGLWSIVGITWLPLVFGIYFAVKLVRRGEVPASSWKAILVAVLGWVLIFASQFLGRKYVYPHGFKATLIFLWAMWGLAGLIQLWGWPGLFKVLLGYGYAARVPVVIVMFLAFQGHWGTHYDAFPRGWQSAGLWSDFLWLGFVPQMVFWVGFTLVSGALFGSIAGAIVHALRRAPQPA
ncbi:MAG: hypothetical protein LAP13_11030 [Acidobacteriia bacterium]|nr:hypothetical protein [Terriglobia bacterium]